MPPGWLDLTPILGIWRNLDQMTVGVASLVLTRDGGRLLVRPPRDGGWAGLDRDPAGRR